LTEYRFSANEPKKAKASIIQLDGMDCIDIHFALYDALYSNRIQTATAKANITSVVLAQHMKTFHYIINTNCKRKRSMLRGRDERNWRCTISLNEGV